MKALAITNKGIEDISACEIKELIKADSEIHEGFLVFEASKEDLFFLCYNAKSLSKVVMLDSINEVVKGKTFAVKAENKEVIEKIAPIIKGKVNLDNPDVIIYAADEKHFGIDLSRDDLSKRDYRIFLGPESLKGNVAYALIRLAEYSPGKALLDPFCRSGVIPIEAALYAINMSPHYFRKDKFFFSKEYLIKDKIKDINLKIDAADQSMNHVNAAKKNAKIAGVFKKIQFSRADLRDIDLKYSNVDCLVTIPLRGKEEEFFKQAELVVKKTGKIVLITQKEAGKLKEAGKKFKLIHERTIMQGKEQWDVLVFER